MNATEKKIDILYALFSIQIITNISGYYFWGEMVQILSFLLFGYWVFTCKKHSYYSTQIQLFVLNIIFIIWNGVFLIHTFDYRNFSMLLGTIVCLYSFYKLRNILMHLCSKIEKKKLFILVILVLVFVLLSLQTVSDVPVWDSGVYYSFSFGTKDIVALWERASYSIKNIYDIGLCGHASYGYSIGLILISLLGKNFATIHILNIIIASISICCFYGLTGLVSRYKISVIDRILMTGIYMFSPFILGLIGNISLDTPSIYFLVIFCYISLKEMHLLELVAATLLCFTKESNLFIYTFFLMGKYVYCWLKNGKKNIIKNMLIDFKGYEIYRYVFPIIMWLILSKLNPESGWSGSNSSRMLWENNGFNCFGFNSNHIFTIIKQVLILNYNWLIWLNIIFIVTISILFSSKKWIDYTWINWKVLIPIFATSLGITFFSCIYITFPHPRYIVPVVLGEYLLFGTFLCSLSNKVVRRVLMGMVTVLLLLQSYITIDPLGNRMFISFDAGNSRMLSITADGFRFDDSIVYNRQYADCRKLFDKILVEIEYDNNCVIILPAESNCERYNIIGDYISVWNSEQKSAIHFNDEKEQLDSPNLLHVIDTSSDLSSFAERKLIYIVPAWSSGQESTNFFRQVDIIKKRHISYKSFAFDYYICFVKPF